MSKQIKPFAVVLSGDVIRDELQERWRRRWQAKWERDNKRAITLTGAEITWLIEAAIDPSTMIMAAKCRPPKGRQDSPIPGAGAPFAVRYFALAYSKSPDETLSFLTWARENAARLCEVGRVRARLAVQAANAVASVGKRSWKSTEAEQYAPGVGKDVIRQAVKSERARNRDKKHLKKSL